MIRKAEMLEPDMYMLYYHKLPVYFYARQYEAWLQLLKDLYKANKINRGDLLYNLALYYSVKGNKQESIEMRDSIEILRGGYDFVMNAGCKYWLNEKDEAFKLLKDSLATVPPEQIKDLGSYIMLSQELHALRSDPRFEEIKKLIGWKPLQ